MKENCLPREDLSVTAGRQTGRPVSVAFVLFFFFLLRCHLSSSGLLRWVDYITKEVHTKYRVPMLSKVGYIVKGVGVWEASAFEDTTAEKKGLVLCQTSRRSSAHARRHVGRS